MRDSKCAVNSDSQNCLIEVWVEHGHNCWTLSHGFAPLIMPANTVLVFTQTHVHMRIYMALSKNRAHQKSIKIHWFTSLVHFFPVKPFATIRVYHISLCQTLFPWPELVHFVWREHCHHLAKSVPSSCSCPVFVYSIYVCTYVHMYICMCVYIYILYIIVDIERGS